VSAALDVSGSSVRSADSQRPQRSSRHVSKGSRAVIKTHARKVVAGACCLSIYQRCA
jgi:hypothetical protein